MITPRTERFAVTSGFHLRAHNSSTRPSIGPAGRLIRLSTDHRVSSSADVYFVGLINSRSCLNLSSVVSEELSCV